MLLPPTPSIPNYNRLTFLTPSLTTRLIQKFMQNITSFAVSLLTKVLQE
jgi:hypothetical protein